MSDIDNLADDRAYSQSTPGEELRSNFLESRPVSQWPSYLDETAIDIQSGIGIGDTELDRYNFPEEVGSLYEDGMRATVGDYSDLPATLDDEIGSEELGKLVFLLNQLSYKINRDDTSLEDVQRAITAVLEKQLASTHGRVDPHLGSSATSTAEILVQLFSDPTVASRAKEVVKEFGEVYDTGLLAKLDEPQMMTPLWEHQRTALRDWTAAGYRGYANMATATGKTVLGLAAIASRYGALHPLDEDLDAPTAEHDGRRAKVLIVAHNDLILEQWRREFDRHLNIPQDRTRGSDDITLEWGRVHFRTAQALINRDHIAYDLVILDEAHHYANGTGWGQLLDSFESEVLALSGSVDEGEETDSKLRERLEETVGDEIQRFSIRDAQASGVVPTFDWEVQYVPVGDDSAEFAEVTQEANAHFSEFRDRLEAGAIEVETQRPLRTHDDICNFSHTTEGKELKQSNSSFRELVTTLFSRRTQRWNQSPRLDVVCDTVEGYVESNVVVLTNNNAQVTELAERLSELDSFDGRVFTISGSDSSAVQRDTVERFDDPDTPGVLVGTGDLIGEGVDMQHADVAVNMSTGNVNNQLIQRIGRVLRNPDGDKDATFVNLVPVPTSPDTQAPSDDGQALLEGAREFVSLGDKFDNNPLFTASSDSVRDGLANLLRAGASRIRELEDDGVYSWPTDETHREQLEQLIEVVEKHADAGPEVIFDAWSSKSGAGNDPVIPTDEGSESKESETREPDREAASAAERAQRELSLSLKAQVDGQFKVCVKDAEGAPVPDAFVSAVGNDATYRRTDDEGMFWIETAATPCTIAVRHPTAGARVVSLVSQ